MLSAVPLGQAVKFVPVQTLPSSQCRGHLTRKSAADCPVAADACTIKSYRTSMLHWRTFWALLGLYP